VKEKGERKGLAKGTMEELLQTASFCLVKRRGSGSQELHDIMLVFIKRCYHKTFELLAPLGPKGRLAHNCALL
jgi:hypothetical protein